MRFWGLYRIFVSSMTIKQKIITTLLGTSLVFAGASLPVSSAVAANCGGAKTAIITCTENNKGVCPNGDKKDVGEDCSDGSKAKADVTNNGVWALLIMAINILTAGIGIAAVGGVIYGAIMYTTAGDNEGQIKQAKEIIRNVVIGLILYVAMYALLQFIIPGGIFA